MDDARNQRPSRAIARSRFSQSISRFRLGLSVIVLGIRMCEGRYEANTPRPPAGDPLEAVQEHALIGARMVRSCGNERYGLICHSTYTNPIATAETTTRCMHTLPASNDCNLSEAGNQRSIYGYRETGFQATYFRISPDRDARPTHLGPVDRR